MLQITDTRAGYTSSYLSLGGSLVAQRDTPTTGGTSTIKYQHTDALGTPVAVTDANRNVIERSEYEPYGQLLNRPITDGPGFTGHVQDAQTGLTYMQQRYYDPQIGRFLSVDPVTATSVGGNFNRYWYGNDNPYRFTDPDGRYGRGDGWRNDDWKKFNRAQQNAAATLTKTAVNMRTAMETGGKKLARLEKKFESTFGPGSATTQNMSMVASSLDSMAGLLKDSIAIANAKDMGPSEVTTAMATPRDENGVQMRSLIVNTAHSGFGNIAEMTISVAHDSFHGAMKKPDQTMQIGGQTVTAYSGNSALQQQAYDQLPMMQRFDSAEHVTNFGLDR